MWRPGSKLVHPFNPELGVGIVRGVEGRFLRVHFPHADQELTLSTTASDLHRLVLPPGAHAVLLSDGETVEIAEALDHEYRLGDGRVVPDRDVWPLEPMDTPIERLASLRLDRLRTFRNRLEGLELMELREAGGLGSFLGGRIELFPHQLHVAQRAVESDPVRWLLADEVGLGKTVEACLILSALVRTGRAKRALVVTPSTLSIQWLGELYRKFHQIFVLLDPERIESVERDYGRGVNPFEVHPFAVVSLELLSESPKLVEAALDAELELLVVDEAHRAVEGAPLEAIAPLARTARHALLLTATPLQADRRGFHRLLSLLHPDAFADYDAFERELRSGAVSLACTSAVRRTEVGGLPPRQPRAIDLPRPPDARSRDAGAPDAEVLRRDPRVEWLVREAREWARSGEKALVFVREVATIEALVPILEAQTQTRVTLFHEELSFAKRDIEVAAFRESSVPLLVCSEAGGEGRNFQFCDRMVHFDLPPDPVELEQRIGRLDRIGRRNPVEIVYFRHPDAHPDLPALYERLGLFDEPAAGLDSALAPLRSVLAAALRDGRAIDVDSLVKEVEERRAASGPELLEVFYPDAYAPELAAGILARVPEQLEDKTREYCIGAARGLGLESVEKGGEALHYFELGANLTVEGLPGVGDGSRYLGTFDREEALAQEELDFFASGHPLVEGLLLELEDGRRGRAALIQFSEDALPGVPHAAGLACVLKDGAAWRVELVEANGTLRPEWVESWLAALPKARSVKPEDWGLSEATAAQWRDGLLSLAEELPEDGTIVAAAFFRCVGA